jgi:hypothetical protein
VELVNMGRSQNMSIATNKGIKVLGSMLNNSFTLENYSKRLDSGLSGPLEPF